MNSVFQWLADLSYCVVSDMLINWSLISLATVVVCDFVWVPPTPLALLWFFPAPPDKQIKSWHECHFDFNLHKLVPKPIESYFGIQSCKRCASTTFGVDVQCLFFWDGVSATVLNNSRQSSVILYAGSSGGQWGESGDVMGVTLSSSRCRYFSFVSCDMYFGTEFDITFSLLLRLSSPSNQWLWQYLDILSYRYR